LIGQGHGNFLGNHDANFRMKQALRLSVQFASHHVALAKPVRCAIQAGVAPRRPIGKPDDTLSSWAHLSCGDALRAAPADRHNRENENAP
jgi:hypothetical protein